MRVFRTVVTFALQLSNDAAAAAAATAFDTHVGVVRLN